MQGSPYYFFGTTWGGCALGTTKYNNLALHYNRSKDFRRFLKTKINNGEISREQLRTLFAHRDQTSSAQHLENPAERIETITEEFYERLR